MERGDPKKKVVVILEGGGTGGGWNRRDANVCPGRETDVYSTRSVLTSFGSRSEKPEDVRLWRWR